MLEIKQIEYFDRTVSIPGSKSYSNRALLIASLAGGTSILKNLLYSDDTDYMIGGLKSLGINAERGDDFVTVYGTEGILSVPPREIFTGNAGTATRFLTGLASLCPGKVTITGDERMKERPIMELIHGLKQLGVNISSPAGCPPVEIRGGSLAGGICEMNGRVSSQYFSSILMVAPYSEKDITINVLGELTSKSYIDITLHIMKEFGVSVENRNYMEFFIKSGQRYSPREYTVEGDASSASYFFAGAAITGGKVTVKNINPSSLQGDIHFVDLLEKMGCTVVKRENEIEVTGNKLKAIEIDMNNMPDTVQTLAVVASFAEGETIIKNVENLRVKETDRLSAISKELRKIGTEVKELKDGLIITPGTLKGAEIETYNDHRMAMSFAMAGLKIPGIKIKNPDCVSKSFPGFWNMLK